jgi:hypothetical protein
VSVTSEISEDRAKLQAATERLAKRTAKAKGYPKHSAKRHYFKLQAQKAKGRILVLEHKLEVDLSHLEGPAVAVHWALKQVGTSESPAGSNLGPGITLWERRTGYSVPPGVFWCGCFASEAVVVHGKAHIPNRNRCGYGPYVIDDARAHRNGFVAVPFEQALPGDYLIFFGGEHQGLCRGRPSGGSIPTVEGNTSPSTAGSQFNGGCVAAKTRSRSDVSCVARPAYPRR